METKTLVYVYPLLRRSTIIVLDKNDQFLLLRNSRYFKNTNFLLITFEKLDFSLMNLGTTLGTLRYSIDEKFSELISSFLIGLNYIHLLII